MNFKIVTPEDREVASEFIQKNLEESLYAKGFFPEDLSGFIDIYLDPTTNDTRIALLMYSDEGEPIGLVSFEKIPFSYTDKMLTRIVTVYINKEYRGKGYMNDIIEAFEFWSKKVGADFCNLGVTAEGVDLSKKGYKKYEVMYMKEI